MALIADVATQEGIAVVLVTHDEDIASAWAERSLSLS
jgi:ABC-type lipoprotein export system ATPase subunit